VTNNIQPPKEEGMFKNLLQQGRSYFGARSVLSREHGTMAPCLRACAPEVASAASAKVETPLPCLP